jgi:hypothetical protein
MCHPTDSHVFVAQYLYNLKGNVYMNNTAPLRIGSTISYRLLPCQDPTNQDKEWHGKILSLHINTPGLLDVALVESTEPDYELLVELILISQIVSIEGSI